MDRGASRPRWLAAATASLLAGVLACPAHAQGTARSMDIDPSPRSAGMGLASNAVFWDGGNHWGNPALLGYQQGLRYEWGRTQLVPGLADDVFFTSKVVKLGGAGVGIALSGQPVGIGGVRLDYGQSEAVDENGNPIGTIESWERIDSWSFGVSMARMAEGIAVMFGHDPTSVSRYADFSFGMSGKDWEIDLGPLGQASTRAHDIGFLFRVSPLEWFEPTRDAFVGLDLAYGQSNLSYDGKGVVFLNEDQVVPPSEHERSGFAGRVTIDWPDMPARLSGPRWLWEGLQPLVSVGYASDHADIGVERFMYETEGHGWEFTVANVFSYRVGHYEDLEGDIADDTWGWSAVLPLGKLGGVRYDFARFPQARNSDLEDLKRRGISAWLDVVQFWRLTRSGSAGTAALRP